MVVINYFIEVLFVLSLFCESPPPPKSLYLFKASVNFKFILRSADYYSLVLCWLLVLSKNRDNVGKISLQFFKW